MTENVDEYVDRLDGEARRLLDLVRAHVHRRLPTVEETISYGMPTFRVDGRYIVYVAAWATHVGFYSVPPLDEPLEIRIAPLRSAKDTVKIPLTGEVPDQLVIDLVDALIAGRTEGTVQ